MRGEIARGATWMVLFRLFDRGVGVLSTILLARLLVPADFGLVAMAMSVIAVIDMATSFGFEVALIQNRDAAREHFDTAWSLNILVAVIGAIASAGLARPAAVFYGDMRLVPVMLAISAIWLMAGFENIGTVNFRRDMDFSGEFRMMAAKRTVAFLVTILCAVLFRSYWALVIGSGAGRVAGLVLSYVMQRYRPRFTLVRARELFAFSGWMLVNNMASVVLSRVPHFVVGRMYGAQALGAYTVGAEIAQLAQTELVAPINRALFPGFSRLVDDPPAFRRICIEATAVVLGVVMPVTVGIAFMAPPVVRVLLGLQWHDAVPVIQILVFAGAAGAIVANNIAAYLALGKPYLVTWVLLSKLVVFGVALSFVAHGGMLAIAHAELIGSIASVVVSIPLLISTLGLRWIDYALNLWRPVLASCLMGLVLAAAGPQLVAQGDLRDALLDLAVRVPVGAVVYIASIFALWYACGRPDSVESVILRRISIVWTGAFRRRKAT